MSDYPQPVAELLNVGWDSESEDEPDFDALGITREHVPDLIRMMLTPDLNEGDPESDAIWAPIHAMRALGHLRAEEACGDIWRAVVADDQRDGDWFREDAPAVFGEIGPAALPTLAAALRQPRPDAMQNTYLRWCAADAIAEVGEQHPEARAECVALLAGHLENASQHDPTLNGGVLGALLDLKAEEAMPVIERAFAARAIDESIAGDLPYIRYELGLGPEPPRRRFIDRPLGPPGRSPKSRAQERAKNRRKQAKASKKRNRKRKR